jgi:hypothetical protein
LIKICHLRKTQKILVIENCFWKSSYGTFWGPLKIAINNTLELSSILAKHLSMYLLLNPQSRNPITRLTLVMIDQKMNERNIFFLFFSWISCPISIGKIVSWHARCLKICKNSDNFASATYKKGYNLPFFKSTHSKVLNWNLCKKLPFFFFCFMPNPSANLNMFQP